MLETSNVPELLDMLENPRILEPELTSCVTRMRSVMTSAEPTPDHKLRLNFSWPADVIPLTAACIKDLCAQAKLATGCSCTCNPS